MAGVRDPAFWKRFSTAVHLDEEQGHGGQRPQLKHEYAPPTFHPPPATTYTRC